MTLRIRCAVRANRLSLVVHAIAVEPAVDAGEDFMGFVDQAEIEGRRPAQACEPRVRADVFAPGEEDAGGSDVDVRVRRLDGLNAEQRVELVLPLSEQRARHDDEDPRSPLRQQLGDDEAGFDGLAETDFVGQDAAAFRDAPQREHDRVDLVRVGGRCARGVVTPLAAGVRRRAAAGPVPPRGSDGGWDAPAWEGTGRVATLSSGRPGIVAGTLRGQHRPGA